MKKNNYKKTTAFGIYTRFKEKDGTNVENTKFIDVKNQVIVENGKERKMSMELKKNKRNLER